MVAALLVNLVVVLNMQFNVSAELPAYVQVNHPSLTSIDVGFMMAIFPLTNTITAPLIGVLLESTGRRNTLWIGICTMTLSTLGFGFASFLKDDFSFYIVSLVIRSVQGLADSCISVATLSIIMMEFPNEKAKYIGYWQLSIGLGLASGPVLGSVLFGLMSYRNTFYFLSAYVFMIGTVCMSLLPKEMDESSDSEASASSSNDETTYW